MQLPAGFQLDDSRREQIRARYEEKGEALTHDDLRELFPHEPALQNTRMQERTTAWMQEVEQRRSSCRGMRE